MKARTTISIDTELLKLAQDKGYNVSGLTESAIINKFHKPDIEEIKELRCDFCGELGEQENKQDVKQNNRKARLDNNSKHPLKYSEPTKLTWLWPDEKWICNKCLKIKCKDATICQ